MSTPINVRKGLDGLRGTLGLAPSIYRPEFPEGELVSRHHLLEVSLLDITPLGKAFGVPPQMVAVIRHPGGRQQTLTEGMQTLHLPAGSYTVQFVKLAKHPLRLTDAVCATADGCNVILEAQTDLRVLQPTQVVNTPRLMKDIETALRGVLNDYVRSLKHPEIIQEPGGPAALSDETICREVANRLRRHPALRGVELLAVSLLGRRPDRIRMNALVEAATIGQERELETLRTGLARQKLEQEAELLGSREAVARRNAAIERSVEEERYQVALAKAHVDAIAAQTRRPILEQEMEFAILESQQRMLEDQSRRKLEVTSDAMKAIFQAMMAGYTLPNGMSGSASIGDLGEVMRTLIGGLVQGLPVSVSPPEAPLSLRTRLMLEADEATNAAPEAVCEGMKRRDDGAWQIEFSCLGRYAVVLECGAGYPAASPRVFQRRGNKLNVLMSLAWTPGMRLADALAQIVEHLHNNASVAGEARADGGRKGAHDSVNPMGRGT